MLSLLILIGQILTPLEDEKKDTTLKIVAPHIVLANPMEPTEVKAIFMVENSPECSAIAVNWGDGETSSWESCFEEEERVSYIKVHKYKVSGELKIVSAIWESRTAKLLARAEHKLIIN